MGKRFVALGLSALLFLVSSVQIFAISKEKLTYAESIAPELKELGMFVGTDKGFELERQASRVEGITMLVRLLGKEKEAPNGTWKHPFTDVPFWADKIVGYAYNHGLTSGVSSNKFGSSDTVSSAQYITFVLRALGYSDSKEIADFTWDNPFDLATTIGLIKNDEYKKDSEFLRADVAIVSYNALSQVVKGKQGKLKDILSTASQKPVEPTPTPTPVEPKPTEPGTGDKREAGVFSTDNSDLLVVDWNATVESNRSRLSGMLGRTYGISYVPGLTTDGVSTSMATLVTDWDNNREGIEISSWRKSYDSSVALNNRLNAVLETFYFYTGDKDVAVSLWKWFDDRGINGKSNTTKFGFTTVTSTSTSATIKKNGIEIDIVVDGGITIVYFK